MESILKEILEKAKTDLHVLQGLKNVAVNNGMYGFDIADSASIKAKTNGIFGK